MSSSGRPTPPPGDLHQATVGALAASLCLGLLLPLLVVMFGQFSGAAIDKVLVSGGLLLLLSITGGTVGAMLRLLFATELSALSARDRRARAWVIGWTMLAGLALAVGIAVDQWPMAAAVAVFFVSLAPLGVILGNGCLLACACAMACAPSLLATKIVQIVQTNRVEEAARIANGDYGVPKDGDMGLALIMLALLAIVYVQLLLYAAGLLLLLRRIAAAEAAAGVQEVPPASSAV